MLSNSLGASHPRLVFLLFIAALSTCTLYPAIFAAPEKPIKPGKEMAATQDLTAERLAQWDELSSELGHRNDINQFASTTWNKASLLPDSDRDPLDVVLRRTGALLDDLLSRAHKPLLESMAKELDAIKVKAIAASVDNHDSRYSIYEDACKLRRRIAFSNPLLNFDKLLFVKHDRNVMREDFGNHMCDQYFGFNAVSVKGAGVYVLSNAFSDSPTLRDVLENSRVQNGRIQGKKLHQGSFLSPALSYDGKSVMFAYSECGNGKPREVKWESETSWHIFNVNIDGSGLKQVTDGPANDFQPCWMPNGRVTFISERRGGYGRCHGRPVPVYTLHSMLSNGDDIVPLSLHESNEWWPTMNHDGMILYTRWDYVDRGFNQAHHPWVTTPDGRDARAVQGNYPIDPYRRPMQEMSLQPVPGSRKITATASAHHGQTYGSLVMLDPDVEDDDAMAPIKRITPDDKFPESEGGGIVYGSATPLSANYYICVYDPKQSNYGVYLLDAFGNKELIYRDPTIACYNPIPLRARMKEPIVPQLTTVGLPPNSKKPADPNAPAEMTLINVYDSLKAWPEGTKITALRIVQVFPKTTPPANGPRIGYGSQKGARGIIGTVPVEKDGSARFYLPTNVPVFFQALDASGNAVQSMRSDTYLHPGEKLTCQGCHNRPHKSTQMRPSAVAMAVKRSPSRITPEVDGAWPFSYPRLVQPIWDQKCVSCHISGKSSLDLTAQDSGNNGWTRSYNNLRDQAFFYDGDGVTTSRSIPGEFGAKASKLYKLLTKGHHGVTLSDADMHRVCLWLDSNSDFYGTYEDTERQAKGEAVHPSLQ